ncbi:SpoIIE family protein phosphatase [Streptomyces sp. NPDC052109]|uniref:SpoIIE family protein phosphatase n=1 Tax=Streptomyces sp. NPDC052109 TaxID=3155527 RepID=UPI003435CA59
MSNGGVLMRVAHGGRVIEWSDLARQMFGWWPREAVGEDLGALLRETGGGGRTPLMPLGLLTVKPLLIGSGLVWEVRSGGDRGGEQELAFLRAMFAHPPIRLHILDGKLRIVRVCDERRGPSDRPVDDLLGRTFPEAYGLAAPEEEVAVARRVLATGEPAFHRVAWVRGLDASHPRRYSLSYVRLEGEHGEVKGLVVSALDVTDRERAVQRLRLLEAVRSRTSEHLDVMTVCRELAEAVVPEFSGIAVVEVIEHVVRGEDPPLAPVDGEVPLRRAAFRGQVSAYPVGEVRRLPAGTPYSLVLTDLRPRLLRVDHDSPWLAADPARGHAIEQAGAHSLIVAPLALRGQALGVVSFYRYGEEEDFDEDDIALASDVCAHAALSIDNARRFARERSIAATLKRRLLPRRPAEPSTVDFSHLHIQGPGGGGAWFDVIELAGARTALVLGDVFGRGIATATAMGQLRTVIHTLAALDLEPDELMARLSDTAARLAMERAALPAGDSLHHEPLTAGCLIAVYDSVDQTCTIVRAGLSDPCVVVPGDSPTLVSVPAGPLLAGTDHAPFPRTTVDLPAGSILAIGNEDLLTPSAGLLPLLDAGADQPLDTLCDTIAYALRDRDETEKLVLLARVRTLPAEQVLTLPLPAEPEAAPWARAATRRQLEAWKLGEEEAFTAEVIVSELVGNAVRYGAPPIRLRLVLDRRLTCEVSDAANSAPHIKHARTVDEGGRGMFIIASLADNWGTRWGRQGKTVWAQQPTGTASGP